MKPFRILVHLLVFVVVLELTTRIDERLRFGTPLMSRVLSSEDLREFREGAVQGRPNARYQKWGLNELGLRGPSTTREPRPGVIRIVTVGASETFGMAEAEGREYPRQLEDSLNSAAERMRATHRFEVLNASLPGMSIPSILLGLRGHIRSLSPDVVVVYPSPSFYVDQNAPHPPDARRDDTLPLTRAFVPRVLPRIVDAVKSLVPAVVMDRLRERDIRKSIEQYPPGWRFTSIPEDRLALYSTHLREVVGTIRSIGAEPILMTHGNAFMDGTRNEALGRAWERFYPRATASTLIAFDSAARTVTLQVARDSGVVAVDVAADLARSGDHQLYSDFAHFTEHGAARVAADLRDSVRVLVNRTSRERDAAGVVLQASSANRVARTAGGLQ